MGYTLWVFNIAMENGIFIDGLPIKNGDFPWQTVKYEIGYSPRHGRMSNDPHG
jgi:hypothetical protein